MFCAFCPFLAASWQRRALPVLAALIWLVCSVGAVPAWARSNGRDDHERALRAVQSGQVLPLTTVLERLGRQYPGHVLEIELERDEGQWIYEIKLLSADGQLMKLKLDASTAAVLHLKVREAGRGGARHPGR
ncbi:MAG: PepSY domain-containing protein [Burkholderiaceae bacterium]|nr:PepSY domain-containing protein [Burkholderiaceae bacterium]